MRGTTVLLTLALTGCAAHSGMVRDGNRAARLGSWDSAVASYERAVRVAPDNERVSAKLEGALHEQEAARVRRLEAAATLLTSAVAAGDWTAAERAMTSARAADPVEAGALGAQAFDTVRGLVRKHLSNGELEQAYPLAMVGVIVSTDAEAVRLRGDVRSAVHARIQSLRDQGAWQAAIEWVQLQGRFETAQNTSALVGEIRTDWAWQLAAQAKSAEAAGDMGTAAMGYHKAFAVDGDRDWIVERDRTAREVEQQLRYAVRWPAERGALTLDLQSRVSTLMRGDARVALVASGAATATVDADVRALGCDDVRTESTSTVQVLVGSRDVVNPDYAPAMTALRRAETARLERDTALTRVEEALEEADTDLRRLLDTRLPPARSAVDRAEADVDWARRRVVDAEDALSAAVALQDDPTVVDPTVTRLEADLARAQARLREADHAAATPRSELQAVERSVATAEREVADQRRARSQAREASEEAARAVTESASKVDRTPLTVSQDVFEPFTYPVETLTRTCSWTATLRHREAGVDEQRTFTATRTTRDGQHAAFPDAGVQADLLQLPASDAAMQVSASDELGDVVAKHLVDASHRYYTSMWDGALAVSVSDTASALDAWLAVLRLDPTVADDTGMAALRSRSGVSDTSWMRQP